MFTTTIYEFKVQEQELHRQAAHYRLVRSLQGASSLTDRIAAALGRLLVKSGQQLVTYAQAAR